MQAGGHRFDSDILHMGPAKGVRERTPAAKRAAGCGIKEIKKGKASAGPAAMPPQGRQKCSLTCWQRKCKSIDRGGREAAPKRSNEGRMGDA